MFKPNPKRQAELKFIELFGDIEFDVTGERVSTNQGRSDYYLACLKVNDVTLATARHPDWRKAYKLLKTQIESIYAEGKCASVEVR